MILIIEFPKALELNQLLYDRVCENLIVNVVANPSISNSIGGRRTNTDFHEQNFKEVDELTSWIKYILPDVSKRFACKTPAPASAEFGYNVNAFEIAECWGIYYNREENVIEHNHFPYTLSFSYYVRTPEGAGPIIIDNKTYEVKEGQCVFFLASQYHSVDQNNCDGRCSITGNISYRG